MFPFLFLGTASISSPGFVFFRFQRSTNLEILKADVLPFFLGLAGWFLFFRNVTKVGVWSLTNVIFGSLVVGCQIWSSVTLVVVVRSSTLRNLIPKLW